VRQFNLAAGNNRLESLTVGNTEFAYSYDVNGNMTTETAGRHFSWNHRDQLKMFRVQSATAEPSIHSIYLYEASGTRVKKFFRKQGGQIESTVYVDDIFEHHRWRSGSTVGENNTLHVMDDRQRIGLVRVGQAHPEDRGPAVLYQVGDHLGSTELVIDQNGSFINREEYTPYGESSFGGFKRKRYRFIGKEKDEESGLNYHGARYYSAWLGRWISSDPIGIEGGLNPYSYSHNSPCVWMDENGNHPGKKGPGAKGSEQDMGELMHYYTLAGLAIRAENLGLVANFESETSVGGSRSGKDRGRVDLSILDGSVYHIYDLKKKGSSVSQAARWVKKYAKYYRNLDRYTSGPSLPAVPGTILDQYPEILAPIFYYDPEKPNGIYAIEFSRPTKKGTVVPGIIDYEYTFVKWDKFSEEWQKEFVEDRGFAWNPDKFRIYEVESPVQQTSRSPGVVSPSLSPISIGHTSSGGLPPEEPDPYSPQPIWGGTAAGTGGPVIIPGPSPFGGGAPAPSGVGAPAPSAVGGFVQGLVPAYGFGGGGGGGACPTPVP